MKNISLKEYAYLMQVNKTAIKYRLAKEVELPGVKKHEMIGNSFVLYFDEKTDLDEARTKFRNVNK